MDARLEELKAYLSTIPVVDTHEHLPLSETLRLREQPADFLAEYFTQYIHSDLVSAGMTREEQRKLWDTSIPVSARWAMLEPYWQACRHTGYGRCVRETVKALYGEEDVTAANVEALSESFLAARKPGRYEDILRTRCHIKTSLLNQWGEDYYEVLDRSFFTPVYALDWLIAPDGLGDLERLSRSTGIPVRDFDSWLAASEAELLNAIDRHATRVFKIATAYDRSIYFPETDRAEAEGEFREVVAGLRGRPTFAGPIGSAFRHAAAFQNYMANHLMKTLEGREVTVQIHTGLHEGCYNEIRNSDPTLLTNLFQRYEEIRFDIFHISYPFQNRLAVLAKNYPNVCIDMCWAHIISPTASIRALREFIDTVPLSKISAFGGDYSTLEQVVGHLAIAKDDVARTLDGMMADGILDMTEAKRVGKQLFYDNPMRIFRIE
ncbi:MAG: amidohydrolase family protein [Oscillospiraceae bacterium]